jgi:hypothetical protein
LCGFGAWDGGLGEGYGFEEERADVGAAVAADGGDEAAEEECKVVAASDTVLQKL